MSESAKSLEIVLKKWIDKFFCTGMSYSKLKMIEANSNFNILLMSNYMC